MSEELIAIELSADERLLLTSGLNEWRGPARCTEEMATAMGFTSLSDLFSGDGERLLASIGAGEPLTAFNWCRAVLATEIVFVSNVMGSGHDWTFTTGLADESSLTLLRQIQRKLPREVYDVIGEGIGTPWQDPPA